MMVWVPHNNNKEKASLPPFSKNSDSFLKAPGIFWQNRYGFKPCLPHPPLSDALLSRNDLLTSYSGGETAICNGW